MKQEEIGITASQPSARLFSICVFHGKLYFAAMEILLICLTTFIASLLTLFSGFGLGTILMPVVALFLPVPVAIAVTAAVHLASKLFKLLLLWRHVDRSALYKFGVPALLAAIPGALLLERLANINEIGNYTLFGSIHAVTPVKVAAGILLILFATAEQVPVLKSHTFQRIGMVGGGLLSGFFGGLTGHQGAFRSAFLVQEGFSERGFIATNAAVAVLVDAMRLLVYGVTFNLIVLKEKYLLVLSATIASFLGVFLGAELLRKVTIVFIQRFVAVMMYALGALLCTGLI